MEFLYSHSKSTSVEYCFFLLSCLSLFFRTVFQWPFCHCYWFLGFFLNLCWEKNSFLAFFSHLLFTRVKPTSIITSHQKQAVLSSFFSSRAIDSNTITYPFQLLYNLGKQGKERLPTCQQHLMAQNVTGEFQVFTVTQTPFKFIWMNILLSEVILP